MGGLQDPRKNAQRAKLEKADQLEQLAERRKLQEQMTSAIENVVARIEIVEKANSLKLSRVTDSNKLL